jgi:hypothetical protein
VIAKKFFALRTNSQKILAKALVFCPDEPLDKMDTSSRPEIGS